MKKVNLGYDVVVTYQTLLQTDIVNKKQAIEFAKDYFKDEHNIELHNKEIQLIDNSVTVE